jgi:hypothetical protein
MNTEELLEMEWKEIQMEFKKLCPDACCSISRKNGIEGARQIIKLVILQKEIKKN